MRNGEAYGYEPARVAFCTCGEVIKAKNLRTVNDLIEAHVAFYSIPNPERGWTEADRHAVYIESSLLDDRERH